MKNTTLYVIGGVLALGVVAYFVFRDKTKGEGEVSKETKDSKIIFTR